MGRALLTRKYLEVSSTGELVNLQIGNTPIPMHYVHALDLSRWIRAEARKVKDLSGVGGSVRALGTLEDLNAPKPKPIPYQRGTAIHVKQKLREWHREDVTSEREMISVKVGRRAFTLHYETALTVAQWLRIRAKEAMRTADDTARKWFEVGNLEDLT